MAKRPVVELTCDRCHRTETQEIPAAQQGQPPQSTPVPEFTATFQGQSVTFGDLCSNCRSAVANYFNSIIKKKDPEKAPEKPAEPSKGFLGLGSGKKG